MNNQLTISNNVVTLLSSTNDGTNTLYINNDQIPATSWVGTGSYTYGSISIAKISQVEYDSGANIQCIKLTDTTYQMKAAKAADNILDMVYPIGAIYMSVNNVNPGTLIGGTWEAWGRGKVPVGVDPDDASFDTVEETGGAKTYSYTPKGTNSGTTVSSHSYTPEGTNTGGDVGSHTLSEGELPIISGKFAARNWNGSALLSSASGHFSRSAETGTSMLGVPSNSTNKKADEITFSFGSGNAHDHAFVQPTFTGTPANISTIQPYITCYMWKRTA